MASFGHEVPCNRMKHQNFDESEGNNGSIGRSGDRAIWTFRARAGLNRPWRPSANPPIARYGVISSTCGTAGVTRGPSGAHTMFTSLRTPKLPDK